MDFSKVTKGERIVLIAGVLLIIDLLFFPWHKIESSLLGVDVNRTGIQSPNGGYGVLALIIAIVMVAQVIAARFTTARLPNPPIPWGQVHFIAGIVVLALLVIKLLSENNFLGFGAWLGILLGAALAFGGFTIRNEQGARPGLAP